MTVPKLSLELAPGKRLGAIALMAMLACNSLDSVTVIVRDNDRLRWLPGPEESKDRETKLRIVACSQASSGMSYSIREGLQSALRADPQAIMVALADQPFITTDLLDRMADVYRGDPTLDYVACSNGSIAMPPVLFAPSMFEALSRLEGDAGARKLIASSEYRGKRVEAESDFAFADVDTPSDLEEARRQWLDRIQRTDRLLGGRNSVIRE